MSSINACRALGFLAALINGFGPLSLRDAFTRSSFMALTQRLKTASAINVTGWAKLAESMTVHLPVPF